MLLGLARGLGITAAGEIAFAPEAPAKLGEDSSAHQREREDGEKLGAEVMRVGKQDLAARESREWTRMKPALPLKLLSHSR